MCVLCNKASSFWGLTQFCCLLVLWFDITHTQKHTHKHTALSEASRLTHPYKQIYNACYLLTAAIFIKVNELFADIKNLFSTMSFLFKNYLLVKVICLLIRCCKTRFILWNTNNTDGANKQNTHKPNTQRKMTLERVSMKISDTSPFFQNPLLFYQPHAFYGKI